MIAQTGRLHETSAQNVPSGFDTFKFVKNMGKNTFPIVPFYAVARALSFLSSTNLDCLINTVASYAIISSMLVSLFPNKEGDIRGWCVLSGFVIPIFVRPCEYTGPMDLFLVFLVYELFCQTMMRKLNWKNEEVFHTTISPSVLQINSPTEDEFPQGALTVREDEAAFMGEFSLWDPTHNPLMVVTPTDVEQIEEERRTIEEKDKVTSTQKRKIRTTDAVFEEEETEITSLGRREQIRKRVATFGYHSSGKQLIEN